jgi:hypothetical protein
MSLVNLRVRPSCKVDGHDDSVETRACWGPTGQRTGLRSARLGRPLITERVIGAVQYIPHTQIITVRLDSV